MATLKPLNVEKLKITKSELDVLLRIAALSTRNNTMRGVAIHRWIDGNLPERKLFEKWCRQDYYPYSYGAWATIRRLFKYHGHSFTFESNRIAESPPHPLDNDEGFPWETSIEINSNQFDWANRKDNRYVEEKTISSMATDSARFTIEQANLKMLKEVQSLLNDIAGAKEGVTINSVTLTLSNNELLTVPNVGLMLESIQKRLDSL